MAIYDLSRYNSLQASVTSMQEQVENINTRLEGSTYSFSSTPVQGGGCKLEDKYNNAIVLKDKLASQIIQNKKDLDLIKSALDKLSEDERKILKYAYINRTNKHIETICQVFNIERTQAYRNINSALNHYVMVRYGV